MRLSPHFLGGFLDFSVADAGGAGAQALVRSGYYCPDGLKIHVPAAIRHVVRVTDFVAELRALAANFTNSCHNLSILAER
jgi:hypothetical protein